MIKKIKNLIGEIHHNHRLLREIKGKNNELLRIEKENYWGNVFNSAIAGSSWMKDLSLNIGRWAGGYNLMYLLFRVLSEIRPKNILELGLGETTKILQAYKRYMCPEALCTSIEQSKEWIDYRTKNDISEELIRILLVETETVRVKDKETLAYKQLAERLEDQAPFDFILIDGPQGSQNYSRYDVVELIGKGYLSDQFVIIMDDYNRSGEKETIREMKHLLKTKSARFVFGTYDGAKDVAVIASESYVFLRSL